MARTDSRYTWDERAGRYRGPGGRFVDVAEIRRGLDVTIGESERRVRALAESLRSGRLTLTEWTLEMRREIKRVHLWNTAAARGGWKQLTPADYGRLGAIVKKQYAYLQRFAIEIERGYILDGRFIARAGMYSHAGRATHEHANRLERREHGDDECRNVLGRAEHCPGCLAETARGWVPIDEMSIPGTRQCRTRCKCRLRFRRRR